MTTLFASKRQSTSGLAAVPEPPYYAVIFSSQRSRSGEETYNKTAEKMLELATGQPGFLGFESVRNTDGCGISVSYWETEEAIAAWKKHADHLVAQQSGRREWYAHYTVRISRVERCYSGPA
jgi:heme-degrading monooxygenase HmoA